MVRAPRQEASRPFSDREVLDAGRALISVSERSTIPSGAGAHAEVLASIDVAQGFRAPLALREALSGDFRSFILRFEASGRHPRVRGRGLEPADRARRLERMGGTSTVVERLGRTFEGRTEIRSFFDELRQRAGAGLFDRLNELFGRAAG